MMTRFTLDTPWGKADHYENLGQGIFTCSTPSHGGIFVPEEFLHNISPERRAEAARWSGSEQWYEEDCCWAYVAEALPGYFASDVVDMARKLNAMRNV